MPVNKASSVGLSVISFYFLISISYQLMFNEVHKRGKFLGSNPSQIYPWEEPVCLSVCPSLWLSVFVITV